MRAITPVDRVRVEAAIADMYSRPYLPPSAVIEETARRMGCCRRQLERAFKAFEASPARELRTIRTELAAACLVNPHSRDKTEQVIAKRVGLADDRALRRVMAAHWGIAPSLLREAAAMHRHLRWRESIAERDRAEWGSEFEPSRDSYRDPVQTLLASTLKGAPIEVRRLVEGALLFPLPNQAAEQARELAAQRVARQWRQLLHEAGLVS